VGDLFYVSGVGLGNEAFGKKCYPDLYPRYMADQIIYDQITHVGLLDCENLTDSFSAPRSTVVVPSTGKPTLRELIVGLEEDVGYSAFFNSIQKPAPLNFFSKTDTSKKLGLILKNILRDQTNNVLRGSEPRTSTTIKNCLTLEQYENEDVYVKTDIPNDMDAWTEALTNIFGIHWGVDVGVLEADTTIKALGLASIKCSGTQPKMYFLPANTMYGLAFNPDNEGVDRLSWMWRNSTSVPVIAPRITLRDTEDYWISATFSRSDDAWGGRGIGVGAANIGLWSGEVDDFNWDIARITWEDEGGLGGTRTIWVDELCFYLNGGYSAIYLQNADSVTKYGRRDLEVPLPAAYPFLNFYQYGLDLLTKYKEPARTLEVTTKVNPATVFEDDEVTEASLLPGWLLQVNIPRYKLHPVVNGGCWWRILRTSYYLNTLPTGGLTVGFLLMSTEAESPEDYSNLNAARLVSMKDPVRGTIMHLNDQDRVRGRQLSKVGW
jgi:hypothetical protein